MHLDEAIHDGSRWCRCPRNGILKRLRLVQRLDGMGADWGRRPRAAIGSWVAGVG